MTFSNLLGRSNGVVVSAADRRSRPYARKSCEVNAMRYLVIADQEDGHDALAGEFMDVLFQERSWGAMAERETYAHLEHLRLTGEAAVDESGDQLRYRFN
jgi:hypothetical protein